MAQPPSFLLHVFGLDSFFTWAIVAAHSLVYFSAHGTHPPHPSFIPKPEGFLSRHGPSGCRPRGLSPSARAAGLMNHKVFVIQLPRFASCVSLPSCSPGPSSLSTLWGARGSLLPPVLASCWLLNPKRSQLHKPCFPLHPPSTPTLTPPQARPVWEPLVAQLVKYLPVMWETRV